MERRQFLLGAAAFAAATAVNPLKALAFPTVYPHGTTIYNPAKCWNGYTVFGTEVPSEGAVLIDMNGNVVKQWKNMCQAEHPPKLLKGGYLAGAMRPAPDKKGRLWDDPDSTDLVVMDWKGNVVRRIPRAGTHHDFQFEGNSVGYYTPAEPLDNYKGKVLILTHKFVKNDKITNKILYDDYIVEVDKDGKVIWDWLASDHFDEMHFSEAAKKTMRKYPTYSMTRTPGKKGGDWTHTNSASYLGPNHWYTEDPIGNAAFHPDNIIISNRQTNIVCIIDKKTKKIVWQVGPTFYPEDEWTFNGKTHKRALYRLGQFIGQHHAHMIPEGLPGAGNIMVYDNGGFAGYGAPNQGAPFGWSSGRRDYSRVVEFNPTNLHKVWEQSGKTMGLRDECKFYSSYVSSAQRLPNGNTLITNGSVGQFQEVTPDHEIVWEYISPYYTKSGNYNLVYRAYRVPYDYVPQLEKPEEHAVIPPNNTTWRLPAKK